MREVWGSFQWSKKKQCICSITTYLSLKAYGLKNVTWPLIGSYSLKFNLVCSRLRYLSGFSSEMVIFTTFRANFWTLCQNFRTLCQNLCQSIHGITISEQAISEMVKKSCVYQNLPEKATVNGVKRTISDITISDAYTLKYSFLLSPSQKY